MVFICGIIAGFFLACIGVWKMEKDAVKNKEIELLGTKYTLVKQNKNIIEVDFNKERK